MEIKKWSLLDSSEKGNVKALRFDELSLMILDGSIQETDLISSPHDGIFVPVKYCDRVSYYCLKRKLHQKMHPEESKAGLPVNHRIFDENSGTGNHERKKFQLFERFQRPIVLLLDKSERVLYCAQADAFMLKPEGLPSDVQKKKGEMLAIFTDRRVIRISVDPDCRYLTDVQFFYYKKIQSFSWKNERFSQKVFELVLESGEVLRWKGFQDRERDMINIFLPPYIEWCRKDMSGGEISENGAPAEPPEQRECKDQGSLPRVKEHGPYQFFPLRILPLGKLAAVVKEENGRVGAELFVMMSLLLIVINSYCDQHVFLLSTVAIVAVVELFLTKLFVSRPHPG